MKKRNSFPAIVLIVCMMIVWTGCGEGNNSDRVRESREEAERRERKESKEAKESREAKEKKAQETLEGKTESAEAWSEEASAETMPSSAAAEMSDDSQFTVMYDMAESYRELILYPPRETMSDEWWKDSYNFELVFIDDDNVPELVVDNSGYWVEVYQYVGSGDARQVFSEGYGTWGRSYSYFKGKDYMTTSAYGYEFMEDGSTLVSYVDDYVPVINDSAGVYSTSYEELYDSDGNVAAQYDARYYLDRNEISKEEFDNALKRLQIADATAAIYVGGGVSRQEMLDELESIMQQAASMQK